MLSKEAIRKKVEALDHMPTIPVVLAPLIRYLERPLGQLSMHGVVELIAKDESLAAQCLHLANSPLFGRPQVCEDLQSAVLALGMLRMRDIAISCAVLKLTPHGKASLDPVVFWEHSLGCALVCRQFAQKIGYRDPGKAYLGGLLHDIGILAHLWVIPNDFSVAFGNAVAKGIPVDEAEKETLGLSHCDSGRIVAQKWQLAEDITQVIGCHHMVGRASTHRGLVALVSLSDLLCRMNGLGYGYVESLQISFVEQPSFAILLEELPLLKGFDWARFTFELEAFIDEVRRLVGLFYRSPPGSAAAKAMPVPAI